jgi:hypothetical protein
MKYYLFSLVLIGIGYALQRREHISLGGVCIAIGSGILLGAVAGDVIIYFVTSV